MAGEIWYMLIEEPDISFEDWEIYYPGNVKHTIGWSRQALEVVRVAFPDSQTPNDITWSEEKVLLINFYPNNNWSKDTLEILQHFKKILVGTTLVENIKHIEIRNTSQSRYIF